MLHDLKSFQLSGHSPPELLSYQALDQSQSQVWNGKYKDRLDLSEPASVCDISRTPAYKFKSLLEV
jgi:hypothetical protein